MSGKYIDVIIGLQWGDEGKGKIVDYLAEQYDIVCRFQGGPNAGHTLKIDGNKFVLHTVPSGIFRKNIINIIGNGVVIDPITLVKELDNLKAAGIAYKDRLKISRKAHLILPSHRLLDLASESSKGREKIGSTLKGIGPTYMDKTGRNGLRMGDLADPDFLGKYQKLKEKHLALARQYDEVDFDLDGEENKWMECISQIKELAQIDCEYYINSALESGKKILAEGAQGSMLDIDHGTYPYVTSSNTITAGVCSGLGVAPNKIGEVIGITKAYCTRVGSGPFPSELNDESGEKLRSEGHEFGATTGRPRRCGWIDLPALKYSVILNGVTQLIMTKLDVLNSFEKVYAAIAYEIDGQSTDQVPFNMETINRLTYKEYKGWNSSLENIRETDNLPVEAWVFITDIEKRLGVPFSIISTGPEREKLILR
ncbi:MAG: adenylosuccinate synthase [Saprospiraceae bacterium]|jgi:adenylosuccinate synthase|nr:MAG: adenylosuccinate synthetase [Candidatus Parvibacillus calidus]MBX2936309.1 adenylosuccinate synthase [Saprospiraceae bacterium]MBK7739120.1 adenylosuccinate synthase [Candidatus Parvibacillus calidus]MBX7179570.1 adenylosuccinate synthase [Saprospiraceae bacterium]MCB0589663.1 adenylosuccinate synthase [Saprospiraceae bacterium]